MYDIILRKRRGLELTGQEIDFFISGYTSGTIPDYQVSALMMAVFFQGLSAGETTALTMAMANSGDMVDLSDIPGVKVDKHSTGGVGDKTTLILAPLVAAAGVPVAKMSGRGLGHTGGTIDKLESIPGFRVSMDPPAFIRQVNNINVAVVAQTGNLVPADKKLYALRDVTATVDSIPLIASSVMSKKIASGADAILLDVKTGSGAFMKEEADAFALARTMVSIGVRAGRSTAAVITDMDQPLGYAVGNALEVAEAIAVLKNNGPSDLRELCLTLGAHMLVLAGAADSSETARSILTDILSTGSALEKFKELIIAQGGNPDTADDESLLPRAGFTAPVPSPDSGYVHGIDAENIGRAAMLTGAGRETKESAIDPSVGIVLRKKIGDPVGAGEPLAHIFYNDPAKAPAAVEMARRAYAISMEPAIKKPLVLGLVTKDDMEE